MRSFSLRHLFLLTSFFCLWFGVYAFWRDVVVFAVPFYAAIAATMGYLVISNKKESIRIMRVGLLTVANIVYGILGSALLDWFFESEVNLTVLVFLFFILLQTGLLSVHSFQLFAQTTRLTVGVLALLLGVVNLVLVYGLILALHGAFLFIR